MSARTHTQLSCPSIRSSVGVAAGLAEVTSVRYDALHPAALHPTALRNT